MNYAIHNAAGRIRCVCDAHSQIVADAQCGIGEKATPITGESSDITNWIKPDTYRLNKRPTTPCTPSRTELPADGTTSVALSQMRPSTVVTIRGPDIAEETVEEGTLRLTFATPGQYIITATAPFPARAKEIVIRATE